MPKFLRGEDEEPEDGQMTDIGDGDRYRDFKLVKLDIFEQSCVGVRYCNRSLNVSKVRPDGIV